MDVDTSPAVAGVLGLPFREQIEHFRNKVHLPSERWNDIEQSAHDRAFVVAGATKADLLADLHASIDKHMHGGEGLEGYRRDFRNIVEKHGWHGWTGEGTAAGEAWRTRVTYMTNLRTSYAAGRYRQLTESGIRYWMWKHNDLVREPRPQHLSWNGLVLPSDHPFWKRHYPPQIPPHWGCRCYVVGVTNPALARRLGGDPDKALPAGWQTVDAEHKTQGPDWNYAPGANTLTPLAEMVEKKLAKLPAPIGAAMWGALAGALAMEQRLAWHDALDAWLTEPHPGKRTATVGAIDTPTLGWLAKNGKAAPETAEIVVQDTLVRGAKQRRHEAAQDALTLDEWRALPAVLGNGAIYFDNDSGNLVFVADGIGPTKAAVRFAPKKAADVGANLVVSAFRVDDTTIAGAVKGHEWELVRMAGGSRTRISGE